MDVSSNRLQGLTAGIFELRQGPARLYLQYNNISSIQPGAFVLPEATGGRLFLRQRGKIRESCTINKIAKKVYSFSYSATRGEYFDTLMLLAKQGPSVVQILPIRLHIWKIRDATRTRVILTLNSHSHISNFSYQLPVVPPTWLTQKNNILNCIISPCVWTATVMTATFITASCSTVNYPPPI